MLIPTCLEPTFALCLLPQCHPLTHFSLQYPYFSHSHILPLLQSPIHSLLHKGHPDCSTPNCLLLFRIQFPIFSEPLVCFHSMLTSAFSHVLSCVSTWYLVWSVAFQECSGNICCKWWFHWPMEIKYWVSKCILTPRHSCSLCRTTTPNPDLITTLILLWPLTRLRQLYDIY